MISREETGRSCDASTVRTAAVRPVPSRSLNVHNCADLSREQTFFRKRRGENGAAHLPVGVSLWDSTDSWLVIMASVCGEGVLGLESDLKGAGLLDVVQPFESDDTAFFIFMRITSSPVSSQIALESGGAN